MKRAFGFLVLAVAAAALLSLSGCGLFGDIMEMYELMNETTVETVQTQEEEDDITSTLESMRYSEAELLYAANTLFMDSFETVSSHFPSDPLDPVRYELRADSLPFTINAYSEVVVYEENGEYYAYPHAWCDYYEQAMKYHSEKVQKIAEEYGLEVTVDGQNAYVSVSSYDQLEDVYYYLSRTNVVYDFTVDEGWITGLFRDMRARPSLLVSLDSESFGCTDEVILLYYTINHTTYSYTKSQLLPAMQEKYIEALDLRELSDPLVTEKIRQEIVHPELNEMRINGEPLEPLDCGDYMLDPAMRFDYNWQHNMYLADVRICAPSEDYDAAPDDIGDDRNFKYLVELLGGTYSSEISVEYSDTYWASGADWWLGGHYYGGTTICYEHIPTDSAFSRDERGLAIGVRNSKEIWGLEDGYDASDYYVRVNPEELGLMLGLEVEVNYEEGYVNYIMPEGYAEAVQPEPLTEYFESEYVYATNANGISYQNGTIYIIYDQEGNVLYTDQTDDMHYVYLTQVTESLVELDHSGPGLDKREYVNIDTGERSSIFPYNTIVNDELVAYYDYSEGEHFVVQKLFDDSVRMTFTLDDLYPNISNPIIDGQFSEDGSSVTILYYDKDYAEKEITVDVVLE